jgi:hypothetical protein
MSDEMTAEQISQAFVACGHSVDLINGIIDGSQMADADEQDRKDTVSRNVEHLKIQSGKDWYEADSESREAPGDKASIAAAITAGEAYSA